MKNRFLTIFSVSAVALALTLHGCGGTNPSQSASQSEPTLSDQAAATLNLESDDDRDGDSGWRYSLKAVIYRLRVVFAPLYDHYGFRLGEDFDESAAYRKMLSEVSFSVRDGVVTVTNRSTGGIIFKARLNDLTHPIVAFDASQIPGGTPSPTPAPTPVPTPTPTPAPTCTLQTAVASCSTCHGSSGQPYPASHVSSGRSLACATCHTSITATATLSGGSCTLSYPTGTGTHGNGTVNF